MLIAIGISTIFWILLTDAAPSSWIIGLPAVTLTVWIIHRFPLSEEPLKVHIGPLLTFVPWFLLKSIRGGLEVSRLALSRPLALHPALFQHECTLANTRSRAVFAMCLNVLPGTTTVRINAQTIHIHSLTTVDTARLEVVELEEKISRMLVRTSLEDTRSLNSDSRGSTIT
ncbi:MAG: multicomponent Na+:H+ antiporter subunit E [Halioglobus sp.]|jgi:multicomponent Na+:H+ antiporter subunit E